MKLPSIDTMAMYLLLLGGINAGINAVFDYDAIHRVIGGNSSVNTVVYALIGLAACYMLADRWGVLDRSGDA
jgi:uncharacterized membrane protein YuzA (DUF378 family)